MIPGAMKRGFEEVLDFFFWGLEVFSRRDCGLILAGLRLTDSEKRANDLLLRMERRRLVQRQPQQNHVHFAITPEGAKRVSVLDPATHWNAHWDGNWHVFTYDLPEKRRRERVVLWRALRAQRFGLLQRSVWVWPLPVEGILHGIVSAAGVPKCFCGFTSERLFLCRAEEIVNSAWNFDQIEKSHSRYLTAFDDYMVAIIQACDLKQVASAARMEKEEHQRAFLLDPMLPKKLWPDGYLGLKVHECHIRFRTALQHRVRELAQDVL